MIMKNIKHSKVYRKCWGERRREKCYRDRKLLSQKYLEKCLVCSISKEASVAGGKWEWGEVLQCEVRGVLVEGGGQNMGHEAIVKILGVAVGWEAIEFFF